MIGLHHALTSDRILRGLMTISACSRLPYTSTYWVSWYGTVVIVNIVAIVKHMTVILRAACCWKDDPDPELVDGSI